MTRLQRLRHVNREELRWRLRALTRIQRDRALTQLQTPKWDRRAIAGVLKRDVVDRSISGAIANANWRYVGQLLAARLCQRPSRFILDGRERQRQRSAILARWPDAAERVALVADRMLVGRLSLLGYDELDFSESDSRIDWAFDPVHDRHAAPRFWADVPYLDPACGDHKIIWELNRHQHWLTLGRAWWLTDDPRYAAGIINQLTSWLASNPPLIGINWASMLELGLRSISWTWALHFLLATDEAALDAQDQAWVVDLLIGLDRQLAHVEQNLSHYFSPNTHLTGEALALYVVGRSIPELAGSDHWVEVGRCVLLREIDRQICADGGHAERSTHYHRYTLDFYLLALLIAERTNDASAAQRFREAVSRAATFARAMADDQGRLPTIGDDDGGMLFRLTGRHPADIRDSLALAAVTLNRPELAPWSIPEEVLWVLGPDVPVVTEPGGMAGPQSQLYTESGYVVIRDGRGGHLTFDVGSHGYMNGGHAHADALAVTLTMGAEPLLVDPGTGTYTMDAGLRNRFRRTANHNTLTVDGRSSSEPAGPFHWRAYADSALARWHLNPRLVWAVAAHDGFAPVRHRRSVSKIHNCGWLILDEIVGDGDKAESHWHFDPRWKVACDEAARLRLTSTTGTTAWLLHDPCSVSLYHGDYESGLGWCAPVYGQLVPTCSARFTYALRSQKAFVTWIGLDRGTVPPAMERVEVDDEGAPPAVGVRITTGSSAEIVVIGAANTERPARSGFSIHDCFSDARLLHIARTHDEVCSIALVDGTRAVGLIEGFVSVATDAPVADLHVEFAGDTINVVSSAPPGELQLRGAALTSVRLLRLNGRELPASRAGRADTIRVVSSDWAAPLAEARTACVA